MFLHVHSGHELFGEVQNARGVFVIKTQFLHASGIPFLPDRSFLCMLEDVVIRRRKASVDPESPARPVRKRIGRPLPIPIHWGSVLAGYRWAGSAVLAYVSLMFAMVYASEGWLFAAGIAGSCASLAAILVLFPLLPRVREATYDEAVRLALLARAGDGVIEQIQKAYGRYPECAIVHGLPLSSRQVLYLYADGELDSRAAARLLRRTRRFVRWGRWTLGEIWPVNAVAAEGIVSREMGLIAALPLNRPDGFREQVMRVARYAAGLKSRFAVNFVLGFYDTVSQRNEDILLVDSGEPGLVRLRAAVDRLEQLLDRVGSA